MKKILFAMAILAFPSVALAQTADDSGISAGFFDSSKEKDINFSTFKISWRMKYA